MKNAGLAAGMWLVCLGSPVWSATPSVDVDHVIAQTTAAMGGADALRNLRNVRLGLAWTEGGIEYTGDYRATRDGHMRIDVFVNGDRVYSEGLDREGAWEQAGEGQSVVSVDQTAHDALARGITYRFDGIWFARERGHEVAYEGAQAVNGVDYHVVKLRFDDGFETYFYINPATWMVERRRDRRAYHPAIDSTEILIESVSDGFAPLCGVPLAMTSQDIDIANGAVLATRGVIRSRCNLADDALDIARPG